MLFRAVAWLAVAMCVSVVSAQDVLVIGGSNCSTGSPGDVVNVPVLIRDTAGTPLGVDRPAGNRIQAFGFNATPTPVSAIAVDGSGKLRVTVVKSGITASLTPSIQSSPRTSTTFGYAVSYDEESQPIPFVLNAPPQQVATISLTLSRMAEIGSRIDITVDPDRSVTLLSNESGTVSESSGNNLTIQGGCVNVVPVSVLIQCPAQSIPKGTSSSGTVTIGSAQPSPTTVTLASSDTSVATVPNSVTIPAGQASTTFPVQAVGAGQATIRATLPPSLGSASATCTVNVHVVTPTITASASPSTISPGASVTLTWRSTNATQVFIGGTGECSFSPQTCPTYPLTGSIVVRPTQTTTYTFLATNPGASASTTVTVTVRQRPPRRRAVRR